jgi:competence protein ComEA
VPRALRGARVSGPAAAALGLALVVLAAALVFGVRVALAAAASAPEPVSVSPARSGGSAVAPRTTTPAGFSTGAARSAGAATAAGVVVVHVVGQVRRPGVVSLPPGSRVCDALARVGGALRSADLAAVNLARPLADGEQLRIPRPGEAVPSGGAVGGGSPGGVGAGAGGGGSGGATGLVDLNTANLAVLEELPGVGPVLAQRILDWRTEHGRFTSVDELAEVSGIGEKMFALLQGKVTV